MEKKYDSKKKYLLTYSCSMEEDSFYTIESFLWFDTIYDLEQYVIEQEKDIYAKFRTIDIISILDSRKIT